VLSVVLAIVGAGAGWSAEPEFPRTEVFELDLRNALFQSAEPTGRDADLILALERIDGQVVQLEKGLYPTLIMARILTV
jgi:hypothetical protein